MLRRRSLPPAASPYSAKLMASKMVVFPAPVSPAIRNRPVSPSSEKPITLIKDCTGSSDYLLRPEAIRGLEKYKDDKSVLKQLEAIKQENKRSFANYVARESGIILNTDAIFDVQVKRLHEYKRQLLNVLHIISLYH